MSGPKVVRIVTREEIETICRGHLRTVSDAADALARFARRHDRLDSRLEQEIANRKAAFEKLLREEQWMEVQKLAPQVASFLQKEIQRMEGAVIAEAAAARCDRRRATDAAKSVAASLAAVGAPISEELHAAAAGSVTDVRKVRHAVEQALGAMTKQTTSTTVSVASKQLAVRLAAGDAPATLDEWLARRTETADPIMAKVDAALAELEIIAGVGVTAPFAVKALMIAAESERGRRALLADSLVLEAANAASTQRARLKENHRLQLALEGLEAMAPASATEYRRQLQNVGSAAADAGVVRNLAADAEAALAAAVAEHAAIARRRALLSGLAELGYEVRQSMTTALAEKGRVVVRKPSALDYGIEISAPANAERMQVRLVGAASPASPRTADRDRDQETVWCGDVDRLRAFIGSTGANFVVDRALGVGAEPVKSVAFDAPKPAEYADVAQPRAQTIK